MTIQRWKNGVWTVAKLGFTGGIVAGVAFAFGVFNPDLTVSESEADILSFGQREVTPTEKFTSSMADLGHSKPQAFNLNGNVVYFSTRLHDESPMEVMEQYQSKFVEKGLAPRKFNLMDDDVNEAMLTAMNGGIVPIYTSEQKVFMGGMIPKIPTKTAEELEGLHDKFSKSTPWEMFKGFHNVEITTSGSGTIATSSWSDENFDYNKMLPGNRALDQNVDPEVPSCPGCTRVSSFEDLDKEQTFRNNVYEATSSVEQLARFYDQSLTARGWEMTESSRVMEKLRDFADFEGKDGIQRQYEKNGQIVTILTHPSGDGVTATAHTVVSD